jgi:hypothetical protein
VWRYFSRETERRSREDSEDPEDLRLDGDKKKFPIRPSSPPQWRGWGSF